MGKLDILVVSFHAKKELAQTLASLALYSSPGYRLTVHDNTAKNYSLTWLWNRFIERSQREFIALVNSDVIVGPGWDSEAIALLESDIAIGNVSPVTNCDAHLGLATIPWPDENSLDRVAELTAELKRSPKRFHVGNDRTLVVGHCMVMRRSTHRRISGFNEAFPFANNDWDFNQRLIDNGFKMGVCLHATSLHWWNASTNDAKAKGISPIFHPTPHGATFDTV